MPPDAKALVHLHGSLPRLDRRRRHRRNRRQDAAARADARRAVPPAAADRRSASSSRRSPTMRSPASLGDLVAHALSPRVLRWLVAAIVLRGRALGAQAGSHRPNGGRRAKPHLGVFGVTVVACSSWPRSATRRRSRRWCSPRNSTRCSPSSPARRWACCIADVPVVFLGKAAAARIPLRAVRLVAAGSVRGARDRAVLAVTAVGPG